MLFRSRSNAQCMSTVPAAWMGTIWVVRGEFMQGSYAHHLKKVSLQEIALARSEIDNKVECPLTLNLAQARMAPSTSPAALPASARETALQAENDALRRALGQQLRASPAGNYSPIWQVCRDLLGVADAQGTWLEINPAWTTVLGWPRERILGQNSLWLVHQLTKTPGAGTKADLLALTTRMPWSICSIRLMPERMNSPSHSSLEAFMTASVGQDCRQAPHAPRNRRNRSSMTAWVEGSTGTTD